MHTLADTAHMTGHDTYQILQRTNRWNRHDDAWYRECVALRESDGARRLIDVLDTLADLDRIAA